MLSPTPPTLNPTLPTTVLAMGASGTLLVVLGLGALTLARSRSSLIAVCVDADGGAGATLGSGMGVPRGCRPTEEEGDDEVGAGVFARSVEPIPLKGPDEALEKDVDVGAEKEDKPVDALDAVLVELVEEVVAVDDRKLWSRARLDAENKPGSLDVIEEADEAGRPPSPPCI